MLPVLLSVAFAAPPQGAALGKLETEYQTEMNPVRQAKLLAKLGPLQVDQASKDFQNDQDDAAFAILERFRDEARKTTNALFSAQPSAMRHPAGFKELQIGLRLSLRRMNDLSTEVPIEKDDQFTALRSDLTATQNSLIEALFPSAKEKHPKDGEKAN